MLAALGADYQVPDDAGRGLPRRDTILHLDGGRASMPTNASVEICPCLVPLAAPERCARNVNVRALLAGC